MHDPRVLLDPATDAVRKLARRGYALDVAALEKLLSGRNAAIQRGDEARAEAKRVAQSVKGASAEERPALVERARELKAVVAAAEDEHRRLDAELQELLLGIPNLIPDEAPDGATRGRRRARAHAGASSRRSLHPARPRRPRRAASASSTWPRATKLAGPRFAVLRGQGAKLERALARYFLDLAEANGYTEYSVPTLVNRPTMTGTGQLPKFESDLFRTERRPTASCSSSPPPRCRSPTCTRARPSPLEEPPATPTPPTRRATARRRARTARTPAG